MPTWWRQAKKRTKRPIGYDPRHVDSFLAHIGAGYASGVDGRVLAAAVRAASFPLVTKGYETDRVDEQLRTLAGQLTNVQQSDAQVIAGFAVTV